MDWDRMAIKAKFHIPIVEKYALKAGSSKFLEDLNSIPHHAFMKKSLLPFLIFIFLSPTLGFALSVEPVAVSELLKTSSSWDGNPLPNYPKGKPEITIVRVTLQPGAEIAPHKHPMINAAVLLSGEITVTTENKKTIHLKAGDSMAEVVNTWHYGKNDGKVPAEFIIFYAGEVGSPITIMK